jgi:hypothetical protein
MPQCVDGTKAPLASRHQARRNRVHLLSRLLDEQFRLPGTPYRVGLDGLLGLIPGVGDALGMLLSLYILAEAIKLGVPRLLLLRMVANIGLDTLVGTIPLVGDAFDIVWKANKKNVALLDTYLASHGAS